MDMYGFKDEYSMLAIDLGASNGRVVHGTLQKGLLKIKELFRFDNIPVNVNGKLYWNVLGILNNIKQGLIELNKAGLKCSSIGLDSWGNSVGLLDKEGDLLLNPYHYRDTSLDCVLNELYGIVHPDEMFRKTWYKPMPIQPSVFLNYIKKCKPGIYQNIKSVLMISDLFNYFLTGVQSSEKTMAATSQMLNMETRSWEREYIEQLGLNAELFPPVVENGTVLGKLRHDIADETGIEELPDVIAVSGHDTASASGCIDTDVLNRSLYLSNGTWSCMGCRVTDTVKDDKLLERGITNDLGLYGEKHLRFNNTGLWILQECRREWILEGKQYSWMDIMTMADSARPFLASINTESFDFFLKGDMPKKVVAFCQNSGQALPGTDGEIARIILESLAFRYRFVRDQMAASANCDFKMLHIIGGGAKNKLLCQYTANALGKKVTAGPAEATVLGNFIQQALAKGIIRDINEGRRIIRTSQNETEYIPEDADLWDKKYKETLIRHKW